jgi:hypothetical protein
MSKFSSRDRLLLRVGGLTGALLVLFAAYQVCAVAIGFFYEVPAEAQTMGNWWLANGLSASIERALEDDAPTMLEQNCSSPPEGFTPVPECVFVRGTTGGPGCMQWDDRRGRCNVVQMRAGLLRDARVLGVIEEASREYCHYIRADGDWATVPACRSPGNDWRLHARIAPATICVVASEADRNRLAFAMRDGQRIRDRWCERVRALRRPQS